MRKNRRNVARTVILSKTPTGISGFDEITGGGLPQGRPTLVCGNAGCGKTLLAMEFIVRGAVQYNEPGVFMAFEETEEELTTNVASLGFDLPDLIRQKKVLIDHVRVERSEIEETGEYDLEGLFIRLNYAIDTIGAKRVVLDTIEALFAGLQNPGILRAELRRLFRWLKEKGVTAIITGEQGEGKLTRHGLEEYVSDCVILLDHRVIDEIATRRLRVVKYRGSTHGTNEYPFLIGERGLYILPITTVKLDYQVSSERITSGVPGVDEMLGGKGFYRGSTIMVSGTPGTGKTSFAAHFADAACKRGERVLYITFEESPNQILRNMSSIGITLEPFTKKDILKIHAIRPTEYGLEMHLASVIAMVTEFNPRIVILDPVNAFIMGRNAIAVNTMLVRLVDFLKERMITSLFTNLVSGRANLEYTETGISSLVDTWFLLHDIEVDGERNRGLYVLKSRGMVTSNQIREFLITDRGVILRDVYVGPGGVLTGSARLAQEAKDRAEEQLLKEEIERKELELVNRRKALEAQIAMIKAEFAVKEKELLKSISMEKNRLEALAHNRDEMTKSRSVSTGGVSEEGHKE